MNEPSRLVFSEQERQTAVWRRFMEHMEQRLELLRQENDKSLSEIDTARLRGRIEQCKAILALDKPMLIPPPIGRQS